MMYAIISKEECQRIGIDSTPRMAHGDSVVITDKELMFSTAIGKLGNDGKEVLNG